VGKICDYSFLPPFDIKKDGKLYSFFYYLLSAKGKAKTAEQTLTQEIWDSSLFLF
jgi:hypothetical protein